MNLQATIKNGRHPEYGVVSIPFPIPKNEYDHVLEPVSYTHLDVYKRQIEGNAWEDWHNAPQNPE